MSLKPSDEQIITNIITQWESKLGTNAPLWTILDQFIQKIPRLRSGIDVEYIKEKKIYLAKKFLKDVELPLLFCAVNKAHSDGHKKRIRDVDEALECIFSAPIGFELMQNQEDLIPFICAALIVTQPLSMQFSAIRALRVLAACESDEHDRSKRCHWILSQSIVGALVLSVGTGTTSIAESATSLLIDMLKETDQKDDVKRLYVDILLQVDFVCKDDDPALSLLRYAELVSRCCALGETELISAQESGALDLVVKLIKGLNPSSTLNMNVRVDKLLQVNALEMLIQIGSTLAGTRYIIKSGLTDYLFTLCEEETSVPLSAGALRSIGDLASLNFGNIGSSWYTEKLTLCRKFLSVTSKYLMNQSNETIKLTGLSSLTDFARSSAWALQLVLEDEETCKCWYELLMKTLWFQLNGGGRNQLLRLKVATLHSFARVLSPPNQSEPSLPSLKEIPEIPAEADDISDASDSSMTEVENTAIVANSLLVESGNSELSELRRRLWMRFGGCNSIEDVMEFEDSDKKPVEDITPVPFLVQLMRQQIPELQQVVFEVLRCAAHQYGGWGLREIFSNAYLTSLLTTGVGADIMVNGRDGMEWKYSLIESILCCPQRRLLGDEMLEFLERVVRNGPFGPPVTLSMEVQ